MDIIKFLTCDKGIIIPKELNEFNWGAFLFTFIWGIRYRIWITLLAVPLILVHLPLGFNWLLYLILQFYCGLNGNKWAYQTQYKKTFKEFRKGQALWGITAISLYILIPIVLLNILVKFVRYSPNNVNNYLNNAQCTIIYKNLNKGWGKVYSANTGEDLAQIFGHEQKNTEIQGQSVIFKSPKSKLKNYTLTFNIYPELNLCSLGEKNCVIMTSYTSSIHGSYSNHCQFYINSKKNLVPDEDTRKGLEKGFNIFKYY